MGMHNRIGTFLEGMGGKEIAMERDKIEIVAKWVTTNYRFLWQHFRESNHTSHQEGLLIVVPIIAVGNCVLLFAFPVQMIPFMTNGIIFTCAACLTIRGAKAEVKNKSPTFSGFWVLFGIFALLDPILHSITPRYTLAKTCVLAWGITSTRPYGGLPLLSQAVYSANDVSPPFEMVVPAEKLAIRMGIPIILVRLNLVTIATAAVTIALGLSAWVVLAVETLFSGQACWVQANICNTAGVVWPLCATLKVMARAQRANDVHIIEDSNDESKGTTSNGSRSHSQGPAAAQWLSYWPMYTVLQITDTFFGWIPHYFSVKLVLLAVLALPQTQGAHLITTIMTLHKCKDPAVVEEPFHKIRAEEDERKHEERKHEEKTDNSPKKHMHRRLNREHAKLRMF